MIFTVWKERTAQGLQVYLQVPVFIRQRAFIKCISQQKNCISDNMLNMTDLLSDKKYGYCTQGPI